MSHSKSRMQAETAFGHLQSRFFARGKAVEEMDYLTHAREEKTSRLREARLAKEEEDHLTVSAKPVAKSRKKT